MAVTGKCSQEVRERAVRMVFEQESRHGSRWETVRSIAAKVGCSAEAQRIWVKRAEIDAGRRSCLFARQPLADATPEPLSVLAPAGRVTAWVGVVRDPMLASFVPPSRILIVEVLRRLLEPKQYLSIRYTDRLSEAGINASVGSIGDSYDSALAETINGLYKAEVIRRNGPWRGIEDVEFATLEWVDWFNNRRLLEPIGNIPPAEFEAMYAQSQESPTAEVGLSQPSLRRARGASPPRCGRLFLAARASHPRDDRRSSAVPPMLRRHTRHGQPRRCSRKQSGRSADGRARGSARTASSARGGSLRSLRLVARWTA